MATCFFVSYKNEFRILHQNIASILSKKEILEITIKELIENDKEPDVICLSETFLQAGHESYVNVYNYKMISTFCRNKKRGGTCILAKKGLICKELAYVQKYAVNKTFECCGVEIVSNKLIIICLYRTPISDPNIFLDRLDCLLNEVFHKHRYKINIVIAGDLNINTMIKTKITEALQQLAQNYNLILHVRVPTRKLSCIDHLISNIKNSTVAVLPLHLSDHETAQLLSFPIKHKNIVPLSFSIYKRDYSDEHMSKFKQCLKNLSWSEVYNETDLNKSFDQFHELFTLFYKLCFPKVKININTQQKRKQNWVTNGLRISCKNKRNFRYLYYKNKTQVTKNNYLKYSKILKKCINDAKRNSNIDFISKSDNKCKASWTIVKNELNDTQYATKTIDKLNVNNVMLTDPSNIAMTFNNHFIKSNKNDNQKRATYKRYVPNSIFLKPITEVEVKNEILSLKNTKSVGYDEIDTKVVKECVNEIIIILTHLINLSFSLGIFPERLKLSIIKPLFKKGNTEEIDSYRPIALISVFSKIFEKCMYGQLADFCNKFRLLSHEQYGFQKNKSTTLAIYSLLSSILESINKKKLTSAIFVDLSKAFDNVSHMLLLSKLEVSGVRGPALDWIKSYLSNRKQCVVIDRLNKKNELIAYSSQCQFNQQGVPQGSVLGPILFLIYINDVIDVTSHKCVAFADDISIIVTSENTEIDHENDINNALYKLIQWLDLNNLKINLTKTSYIQFNKHKNVTLDIHYLDTKIDEVKQTKFLGLTIDQDINWKTHIDNVCVRVNRFVYALKQVRNVTDVKTAIATYHAYVESILRYGLLMWGNSTEINKVFIAQKKCIRAICGVPPLTTCRPLFPQLQLLTLTSLYIFEICLFVMQNKQLFKRACDIYPRNTRNPNRLVMLETPKTMLYRKSCLTMCVKIFNNLPNEFKLLDKKLFKLTLYKWLISQAFYDIKDFLNNNFNK